MPELAVFKFLVRKDYREVFWPVACEIDALRNFKHRVHVPAVDLFFCSQKGEDLAIEVVVILLDCVEPSIVLLVLDPHLLDEPHAEHPVGIQKVQQVLFADAMEAIEEHRLHDLKHFVVIE